MELYHLCSGALAVIATITLLWPLNIPLAALAYKVRHGGEPVPMEPRAFWLRSTFAALGLAVFSLVMLGVNQLLVAGAEFPAGPIHLILFMAYLPAGVWHMYWMFALEDMLQGLSVFLLYIFLPGLPLLLIGLIFNRWLVLTPWLLTPTS